MTNADKNSYDAQHRFSTNTPIDDEYSEEETFELVRETIYLNVLSNKHPVTTLDQRQLLTRKVELELDCGGYQTHGARARCFMLSEVERFLLTMAGRFQVQEQRDRKWTQSFSLYSDAVCLIISAYRTIEHDRFKQRKALQKQPRFLEGIKTPKTQI